MNLTPRILIVEDSPTQAMRLQAVLEDAGFVAVIARDAEDALRQLAAESFDLMISDIVMPGMSGYELCRAVKAMTEHRSMPVILLTTRKDPMDIFLGLECGADNFYTKPYDAQRLIDRLRNILHNRALRVEGRLRVGLEFSFFGKTFSVGAEREQILDLLVSTFEDIVQTNLDLERARDELTAAKAELQRHAQHLEQRVRASEELHRAIVESISDGIIALDGDGAVQAVNGAAQAMFGWREDEVVGRRVRDLMPASLVAEFLRPGVREVESRPAQSDPLPLRIRVGRLDGEDQSGWLAVVHDLTEEHKTEQRLRQAQRMESVGQLTGGIAHDFNNLLTVIIGGVESVGERLAPDDELTQLCEMALSAAERGADLTRRLLAFARKQTLEPEPVDVGCMIDGMEQMLRRTLGEQITFRFETGEKLGSALVDPSQLESALLNLCINARDAMPQGGRLTIEAGSATLDDAYAEQHFDVSPGDYIMLAVSDTGSGMTPDVVERAFEPFFTTKPIGKGTGLGLAMVFGFVKQSGGHVRIYSEPGHGTTVRLYLPCATQAAAGPARPPQVGNDIVAGEERILLVEDDELVRINAERMLRVLGYQVVTATDGVEAMEILSRGENVDLLFTDVVLPGGMSGPALADAARALRAGLRVLYSSGYTDKALVHNGKVGSSVHLLSKPYRRQDLARKVREALAS